MLTCQDTSSAEWLYTGTFVTELETGIEVSAKWDDENERSRTEERKSDDLQSGKAVFQWAESAAFFDSRERR